MTKPEEYAYIPTYANQRKLRIKALKDGQTGYTVPLRTATHVKGDTVQYLPENEFIDTRLKGHGEINTFRLWHGGQGSIRQKELDGAFNQKPTNRFARKGAMPSQIHEAFWQIKDGKPTITPAKEHKDYHVESRGHNLRSRQVSVYKGLAHQKEMQKRFRELQKTKKMGYDTTSRMTALNDFRQQLRKVVAERQRKPAPNTYGTYA